MAVFIGHVMTPWQPGTPPHWLSVDWPDLSKHAFGTGLFGLAYYLSYAGVPDIAWRNTVLYACGWCALCEIMQHWIPARDFSVIEFGVNVLSPLLVASVLYFLRWRD